MDAMVPNPTRPIRTRLVDGWVHDIAALTPPERTRARLVVGASFMFSLASLSFAVAHAFNDQRAIATIHTVAGALALVSVLLVRGWGRVVLAMNWLALLTTSLIFAVSWVEGGVDLGTLMFLAIVPMATWTIDGARAAVSWTAVSVAVVAACGALQDPDGLEHMRAVATPVMNVVRLIGLVLIVFGISFISDSFRARALRELDRANRELEVLRDRAEAANRAKSEFLATVSHELRTPMNGVIGMTSLLETTQLNDEQRSIADTLRASGDALLHVINDILDFERIEAGHVNLHREPFELRALVKSVCAMFATRVSDKGLVLSTQVNDDVPAWVSSDPARLRQVLVNLLGNAVKFTPSGTIDVLVSVDVGGLVLRVRDSGIGIPPEARAQLFQPFMQVDSAHTRRFGGTGLGLAISRRITDALGGTIDVDSATAGGSTFTVRVPLVVVDAPASSPAVAVAVSVPVTSSPTPDVAPTHPPGGAPARTTTSSGSPVRPAAISLAPVSRIPATGPRVLVVEDNFVNQQVACRYLATRGITAQVANNGVQALELLAASTFDLVLMDCQMPEMDGFAATRALRKRETERHTPVVAMTASVQPRDRAACIEAGMDDYVPKPLRFEELDRVLLRYAGHVTPPAAAATATSSPGA
jgi:signal transduction histidine kinase/ActR/RegA family two-component response regulator